MVETLVRQPPFKRLGANSQLLTTRAGRPLQYTVVMGYNIMI